MGKGGGYCLKQVIPLSEKPIDWERRATPPPYTILGGQELTNYSASCDFYMENCDPADYDAYMLLGVRCNFSPMSAAPAACYNLCIFQDGRWQLRNGALILACGCLNDFAVGTWHNASVRVKNARIDALFDGNLLASVEDHTLPSGQVVIGSGYNIVRFDNLLIEAIGDSMPAACYRYQELDSRIRYHGNWTEYGNDARNYSRTLLKAQHAGDSMEFMFHGTAVSILGVMDCDCGQADIYLDGRLVSTIDAYSDCTEYRKSLFSAYGLEKRSHSVRLVVNGTHGTDAVGIAINIDAVEVLGGGRSDIDRQSI